MSISVAARFFFFHFGRMFYYQCLYCTPIHFIFVIVSISMMGIIIFLFFDYQ